MELRLENCGAWLKQGMRVNGMLFDGAGIIMDDLYINTKYDESNLRGTLMIVFDVNRRIKCATDNALIFQLVASIAPDQLSDRTAPCNGYTRLYAHGIASVFNAGYLYYRSED